MGEALTEPTCGFACSCWEVSHGAAPAATQTITQLKLYCSVVVRFETVLEGGGTIVKHSHMNN